MSPPLFYSVLINWQNDAQDVLEEEAQCILGVRVERTWSLLCDSEVSADF